MNTGFLIWFGCFGVGMSLIVSMGFVIVHASSSTALLKVELASVNERIAELEQYILDWTAENEDKRIPQDTLDEINQLRQRQAELNQMVLLYENIEAEQLEAEIREQQRLEEERLAREQARLEAERSENLAKRYAYVNNMSKVVLVHISESCHRVLVANASSETCPSYDELMPLDGGDHVMYGYWGTDRFGMPDRQPSPISPKAWAYRHAIVLDPPTSAIVLYPSIEIVPQLTMYVETINGSKHHSWDDETRILTWHYGHWISDDCDRAVVDGRFYEIYLAATIYHLKSKCEHWTGAPSVQVPFGVSPPPLWELSIAWQRLQLWSDAQEDCTGSYAACKEWLIP